MRGFTVPSVGHPNPPSVGTASSEVFGVRTEAVFNHSFLKLLVGFAPGWLLFA